MNYPSFVPIITAIAALVGAVSPIIVALIQSSKEKGKPKPTILVPDGTHIERPRAKWHWLTVLSFALIGGSIGFSGAKIINANTSDGHVAETQTPIVVPEILPASEIVTGAFVTFRDDFEDNSLLRDWKTTKGDVTESNNMVSIIGNPAWTNLIRIKELQTSEAALVLFRYDEETDGLFISLESGDWSDTEHRQWGFSYDNESKRFSTLLTARKYTYSKGDLMGSLEPIANRWYYVSLELKDSTDFYLHIWEKDNPSVYSEYYFQLDKEWTDWKDKNWHTIIGANSGKVELDYYEEVNFTQ